MVYIIHRAGVQVIKTDHLMSGIEQLIAKVGANESGTAGYQSFLH
jgi:hypothetical protein